MIMLSSILILILAFWSLFTGLKKPEPVKVCSIASIPFYMLMCLLSIILFVLATALGDCCTMAFGYNPPPLELFLPTASSQIPSQIVNARALCVQNKSIVQIFTDLNFTTGANLNISERASPLIDDLDFSGITNGLDLRQAITLSTTPTSALSPLLNLDLNGLITNDLVTIRQTAFPNLRDQINNLKLVLEGFLAQDDPTVLNSLTINGDNSISAAQNQQSAVGDFRSRLTAMLVSINDLTKTGGTLDLLTTQITGLETLITNLRNQLQDLKTSAQSIPPYYDSAQSGMQTLTSQANTSVVLVK